MLLERCTDEEGIMTVSLKFVEQCLYSENIYVRLSVMTSLSLRSFTKGTMDLNHQENKGFAFL